MMVFRLTLIVCVFGCFHGYGDASDCRSYPVDIVFLLDSSTSVWFDNFGIMKEFVVNITNKFEIGPNKVQIGVATFSSTVENKFYLNAFTTNEQVVKAIHCIWWMTGGTRTDLALSFARTQSFQPDFGDRPGVPNFLILMTGGESNQPELTVKEAKLIHEQGDIKVFALGIGKWVNPTELQQVASTEQDVFVSSSFDTLYTVADDIQNSVCNRLVPTTPGSNRPITTQVATATTSTKRTISAPATTSTTYKTTTSTVRKLQCVDKVPNCGSFGIPNNCAALGIWAKHNCIRSCNLCNDVCLYNGSVYVQGEVWHDGCTHACECTNASSGSYTCTARCHQYATVPPQCQLKPDSKDSCCMTMVCDSSATTPVLYTQTVPSIGYCDYRGKHFGQGEVWHDGCGIECSCEDAMHQFYQCRNRCRSYYNITSGCTSVQDTRDICCLMPNCQNSLSGFKGTVTAFDRPFSLDQDMLKNTGYENACVYKGRVYSQGEAWYDGCDYQCQCIDGQRGVYKCTDRCPEFTNVQTGCRLSQDWNDACCSVIKCN